MKKNLDSILSGWIPSVLIIISQWRCMVNRTNLYQIIEKSILQHPSISTPTASLSMADQFPPHGVCLQTNCPVVVVRKLIPRSGCSTILTFCRKQTTSTARESHLPSSPMYWLMISWTHHTLSCFATNEFIQLTWCACWMNPPLDESKTKLALFRGGCCGHTQTPRWDWYWCRRGRRRHRRSIDRPSPYNIIMCGQFTRRVGLYWTSPRSSTGFFFSLTLSYCSRDFHCWEFVVSRTCIDALGSICDRLVRGEPAGWDIRESKWIFGRFCWNIGETSEIYWIIYVRLWVCVCRWSVSGASHLVRSSQKFFLLVCLVRVRSSSRGFARQAVTPGFMQPTNLHIGRILLEDVLVFQMLLFCW